MEDRVERLLLELCTPESYEVKASSDIDAVERGLNFIMQLAVDEENFRSFGSDIFQTFYDISTSAEVHEDYVARTSLRHNAFVTKTLSLIPFFLSFFLRDACCLEQEPLRRFALLRTEVTAQMVRQGILCVQYPLFFNFVIHLIFIVMHDFNGYEHDS
jgi:hypothetical protein